MREWEANSFENIDVSQFEALLQISRLLNSETYSDNLISRALDIAIDALKAERGLFVRVAAENSFVIVVARNIERENIGDLTQFSSGILKKVLDTRKPCLYHDVASDPTVSQYQSVIIQGIKSVLGVPILLHEQVWGILLVDSRANRGNFNDSNLHFLEFFSNMVSLALDKIQALELLKDENQLLRNQIQAVHPIPDMVGTSAPMQKLADLIHRVAATDATVLILGESGTGKELVARAIHQLSNRRNHAFLAQFCGSIPDTLLESELFGYKKGAFSGATTDKKGLFEVADNGTFFLDEIADVPGGTQVKLLRVLQNREIIRLGDTRVKKVDCRIIAATNQNLKMLVKDGTFREDLFYRLNVFPITVPALRERRSDIVLLVNSFIKKLGQAVTLSPAALKKLLDYAWPGNVRELENVIQRALILCDGKKLLPQHLILDEDAATIHLAGTLKEIELDVLQKRLDEFKQNRTQTAASLGVSVRWVQLKLKEIENTDQS